MKKSILLLILIAIFSIAKIEAQAVLEHQYDSVWSFTGPFHTYSHGYVYAKVNYGQNLIELFDSQHVLIKTLSPAGNLYSVINVSDHLFNSDDKLELLVAGDLNQGYGSTFILNEDNMVLQTFDGQQAQDMYPVFQINGIFKLKLFTAYTFYIYNLPGTAILDVPEGSAKNFNKVFPNPASKKININCPAEATSIVIYGMNGAELYRKNVIGGNTEQLDISSLSSGIYLMKILSKDSVIDTVKFQVGL